MAAGRSLTITLDPEREKQPEEMNRSKRGRRYKYSDLLMGGIAYLRYMIGKGARITEGAVDEVPGGGAKGPGHVTAWRRARAQAVRIGGNRIAVETADGKARVLLAGSPAQPPPARTGGSRSSGR